MPGFLRPIAPLSILAQEQGQINATSVKERRAGVRACGRVCGTVSTEPPAGPLHARPMGQVARASGSSSRRAPPWLGGAAPGAEGEEETEKVSKPCFSTMIGRVRRVPSATANGRHGPSGSDRAGRQERPASPRLPGIFAARAG